MTTAQQLIAKGFTVNPNNIHSLPGQEFSAGSAGQKTILFGYQIRVIENTIYILKEHVSSRKETSFVDFSHSVVETYSTVDGLLGSNLLSRVAESLPSGIWGD